MQRRQFNYSALRDRRLLNLFHKKNFSRREFLGLSGTAALGAASQLKLGRARAGKLEIAGDEQRLAFLLDGEERWVIDPQLFSGPAKLSIHKAENLVRFELSRAIYPGTKLPADLTGELHRTGKRWRMHLRMKLGNFRSTFRFEEWLAGNEVARSRFYLHQTVCEMGRVRRVVATGPANATFEPAWVTAMHGKNFTRMLGS